MQRFGVFIAYAAHNGLRQSQRTNANQQPLADIQRHRHFALRKRLQHIMVIGINVIHNIIVAAACAEHGTEQNSQPYKHGNSANGIGNGNALKTANGSVKNYNQPKKAEACKIRKPGNGFKQFCRAYKLRNHCAAEKHYNKQRRHIGKKIRLITPADNVYNRNGINFTRNKRNFFAENTQNQKYNNNLHNGHIQPAVANQPRHARPANKRAYGAVRCHSCHGKHKTAQAVAADKIIARKICAALFARSILNVKTYAQHKH